MELLNWFYDSSYAIASSSTLKQLYPREPSEQAIDYFTTLFIPRKLLWNTLSRVQGFTGQVTMDFILNSLVEHYSPQGVATILQGSTEQATVHILLHDGILLTILPQKGVLYSTQILPAIACATRYYYCIPELTGGTATVLHFKDEATTFLQKDTKL